VWACLQQGLLEGRAQARVRAVQAAHELGAVTRSCDRIWGFMVGGNIAFALVLPVPCRRPGFD
jgi:hypothetical protein